MSVTISVVTPTLRRPLDVDGLLDNLSQQTVMPYELILVDGAPASDAATEEIANARSRSLQFEVRYIRRGGGTAVQRNAGIEVATGEYVAFVDDDIRLDPHFFERILEAFGRDTGGRVGGIAGYITNQFLDPETSPRWRWYKRLKLFTTYEPGRYDFDTGYPINRYLQPPHEGLRRIDFMGAGCAVWRRTVFERGLRFGEFFSDYGILEDAHFALRAGKDWDLFECGSATCTHLRSNQSRQSLRLVARKSATNYRYVFVDLVPHRSWQQELRFWRVQVVDLARFILFAIRSRDTRDWLAVVGKVEGILAAVNVSPACAHRGVNDASQAAL